MHLVTRPLEILHEHLVHSYILALTYVVEARQSALVISSSD